MSKSVTIDTAARRRLREAIVALARDIVPRTWGEQFQGFAGDVAETTALEHLADVYDAIDPSGELAAEARTDVIG